ncbi:histone-lysine N-methyltransferase, H3 lysine-9 specific SUVH4-like [Papaver somniferum]|uniref:histone-lysine N-methyltransferase, H3 lysine-9 specific SUVH4-like n=1 Tax=Papaver somniferum TaxID=3469 RepID=UPI000E6FC34F|nr:histone-lysine N-methyltransferase, H3 lysine-9 specific SUVH4-like [Papaver somniferum]
MAGIPAEEEIGDLHYAAVQATINQFYEFHNQLCRDGDDLPDQNAVARMQNEGAILFPKKQVGNLPGVGIGQQFFAWGELDAVGFHSHDNEVNYGFQDDFPEQEEYRNYTYPIATSIAVLSMRCYEEVVEYCITESDLNFDDKIRALKNNEEQRIPLRLIRKHKHEDKSVGMVHTYDGLYDVVKSFAEEGVSNGVMYRLNRREGQILTLNQDRLLNGYPLEDLNDIAGISCDDISAEDPERIPIIATNVVDDAPFCFPNFRYSKSMVFAKNVNRPKDPAGCNCVGSCSDPLICPCARLNVTHPYSEDGRLPNRIPIIYECGKRCACGPSCQIKKTQCGLQYRLEVFRTPQKGWGVRTRDFIHDGTYLGEYVGKIRTDKDADTKPDTYLFDIDPPGKKKKRTTRDANYCIDGEKVGNFVRFINHSCDPNLFVQRILSHHHDINYARISLFAGKDIAPMEELTYDYNYKINSVKVDGQIKMVKCRCSSRRCRKRLM